MENKTEVSVASQERTYSHYRIGYAGIFPPSQQPPKVYLLRRAPSAARSEGFAPDGVDTRRAVIPQCDGYPRVPIAVHSRTLAKSEASEAGSSLETPVGGYSGGDVRAVVLGIG